MIKLDYRMWKTIVNIKCRKALKRIYEANKGKLDLSYGDKGEYQFDGKYGVGFDELNLPEDLKYRGRGECDGFQYYNIETPKGKNVGYIRISKDR